MITDPARFTLDAVEHLRSISDVDECNEYLNELLVDINELDSETAARIMYNFFNTPDVKISEINRNNVPNFRYFMKKHGRYLLESVEKDGKQPYRKLYTREDKLNT